MIRGPVAFLLALSVMPLASSIRIGSQKLDLATDAIEAYTFDDYVTAFSKPYKQGTSEWKMREEIFEKTRSLMGQHNKGPKKLWQPGWNKFSDWTKAEFQKLMGYKGKHKKAGVNFGVNFNEVPTDGTHPLKHSLDLKLELPEDYDNREHLPLGNSYVRDQGACGSCWAVSSATVLEAHLEMNREVMAKLPKHKKFEDIALSAQAITSCTLNLNKCGGAGGCEGATAELAFEMVQNRGIPMGKDYLYQSGRGETGKCEDEKFAMSKVSIGGFVKLPENKYHELMHALYQVGPAVVSVAASSWSLYKQGIFEPPDDDFVVNHAVAATGYGIDRELGAKYWMIKNSWGKDWGEEGHIRVLRTDEEEKHCGWDESPEDGTGCIGGPKKVWVCGHSGVLYDSSYPVDVHAI